MPLTTPNAPTFAMLRLMAAFAVEPGSSAAFDHSADEAEHYGAYAEWAGAHAAGTPERLGSREALCVGS